MNIIIFKDEKINKKINKYLFKIVITKTIKIRKPIEYF